MTAKGIMGVYRHRPFYIIVTNIVIVDLHLPKHQKTGEVANVPRKVFHIKDEHFSYQSVSYDSNSDNYVHAVHYEPILDRLKQIAEHETVKKKVE